MRKPIFTDIQDWATGEYFTEHSGYESLKRAVEYGDYYDYIQPIERFENESLRDILAMVDALAESVWNLLLNTKGA